MSFWSSEKLLERSLGQSIIHPFCRPRIKYGSYELTLGNEVYITSQDSEKKQRISLGETTRIPPGQFGLLITSETVSIPRDAIGLISIKAGIKFRGLVNVSGFHVDPGFTGCLKFSVYNAGSQDIVLTCGEEMFLIWFCDLDRPTTKLYDGKHMNQDSIVSAEIMNIQGEIASPGAIMEELKAMRKDYTQEIARLNDRVKFWEILMGTILGGVIAGILVFVLTKFL